MHTEHDIHYASGKVSHEGQLYNMVKAFLLVISGMFRHFLKLVVSSSTTTLPSLTNAASIINPSILDHSLIVFKRTTVTVS